MVLEPDLSNAVDFADLLFGEQASQHEAAGNERRLLVAQRRDGAHTVGPRRLPRLVLERPGAHLCRGELENAPRVEGVALLADRLGGFEAAFTQGTPQELQIEYCGDVGVTDVYPVTAAILTGFLRPMVDNVNMVSAPLQLEERGISSSEKRSAKGSNYNFEIRMTVVSDSEEHTVSGTLFQGGDPRICSIDDLRVDARPEGHMLMCYNDDVPLIIGRVCTRIGEAGVNIANLMLGRDARGGHAMTVINLDQPLNDEALEAVRAVPHVNEARLITLSE
mgnify:CR=1 FL=1